MSVLYWEAQHSTQHSRHTSPVLRRRGTSPPSTYWYLRQHCCPPGPPRLFCSETRHLCGYLVCWGHGGHPEPCTGAQQSQTARGVTSGGQHESSFPPQEVTFLSFPKPAHEGRHVLCSFPKHQVSLFPRSCWRRG